MIYIFEQGNIVYNGNTLTEDKKKEAVVVTEKPVREEIGGKIAVLKWDVETQTAWYEYEDIPSTSEQALQERIAELEGAVMELTMALAMVTGGAE